MLRLYGVPSGEDLVSEVLPASEEAQIDVTGVHEGERTHIKKVPGPNGTVFISCNNGGFAMPEAGATAV